MFHNCPDEPQWVRMDEIKRAFPLINDLNIRKCLKLCSDFKRVDGMLMKFIPIFIRDLCDESGIHFFHMAFLFSSFGFELLGVETRFSSSYRGRNEKYGDTRAVLCSFQYACCRAATKGICFLLPCPKKIIQC